MDNCSICETTDDVIRPMCCQEKNTICRKCIDKVDMCPFCRTEKTENLLPLLQIVEAEHRKVYERYAYTRFNVFNEPTYFDPWKIVSGCLTLTSIAHYIQYNNIPW